MGATQDKFLFFSITFLVAFCSIIYELIFAQILSMVFGSTLIQYSLVIGFYMFSLGMGSFAVDYFIKNKNNNFLQKNFVLLEMSITFSAILGGVFMLYLSAFVSVNSLENIFFESLAFIPVILVGFLSGAELPLLLYLYNKEAFTQVLGIDYFGSLLGTVAYSLLILPNLGLISTLVFTASLNMVVALFFAIFVYKKNFYFYTALLAIFIFLFSAYFASKHKVDKFIESLYLAKVVENVYAEYGVKDTKVVVSDILTTPYQQAIEYDITFMASTAMANTDHCLNLDRHLQACGNWTDSYHHGLVDVPLSLLKQDSLDILILGGGDFIPLAYLKQYDNRITSVDLVDIDADFQNYAKYKSVFLRKYNQESYKYKKLKVHIADAFHYLKNNDKKYDLILFDLPGIKHDKLLPLYSKEMFKFIKNSLKDDGVFVSWFYPKDMFPKHSKVLENTLLAAGFLKRLDYFAYNDFGPGRVQETEQFFVLPKKMEFNNLINSKKNKYSKKFAKYYTQNKWYKMSKHENVSPNSVFKPNNDIIVFKPILAKTINNNETQ